jgi:WXXGXW repeat (2 copies)
MRRFGCRGRIAAAAMWVALLGGCAGPDPGARVTVVAAPYPPPAKRAEIPPPAPAADLLWCVGHWHWNGVTYAWTPGHYLRRPTPTANWMPGYWAQGSVGWIWTEGHWQS